ncbi:MAG: NADPH:quinone reductase Zn-dependent oxidoreductase [Candidatus Saccharibacteria bacterium]|nr:NADPH:quinone reductase Zn-dependent oxidoreductase [Candidatus Saccharibacteria bacterium]
MRVNEMKAAQINEYGDASVIQINEVSEPTISEGHVLVAVHAASLNPFDSTVRSGYMKEMVPLQLPVTIGGDIAGIVTAIGNDITHVAVGDKVYGQANVVAGDSGAFAEFAATASAHVAKMPASLDFNQAASLPLIGVSALQALTQHITLQAGQKIFIHGGAGNIGMIAIQVAKYIGAYIATTATGDDIEAATSLGADEVIDYKTQDFAKILEKYDAVFDTVGGDDFTRSLNILKPEGIAVSMAGRADETIAKGLNVQAISQMTQITTEMLTELSRLVEAGVITPQIGKVLPFSQIKEAFEARESGTIHGKVVVEVS